MIHNICDPSMHRTARTRTRTYAHTYTSTHSKLNLGGSSANDIFSMEQQPRNYASCKRHFCKILIMVTLVVSFMNAWCVHRTVTRHPQLFGFNFGCTSCPTVEVSTVSPMTFATARRDQRVLESNDYASTCQSEALVHVGLFAQWLVQSCRVALSMSGSLSFCVMAKMGISTL